MYATQMIAVVPTVFRKYGNRTVRLTPSGAELTLTLGSPACKVDGCDVVTEEPQSV